MDDPVYSPLILHMVPPCRAFHCSQGTPFRGHVITADIPGLSPVAHTDCLPMYYHDGLGNSVAVRKMPVGCVGTPEPQWAFPELSVCFLRHSKQTDSASHFFI